MIFGRHDLVQDAPISKLDLLVCRNVLMYLNAETQSRVLARLHFGLAPDGFLFLGKAEMLLSHADLFRPVDLKQRDVVWTNGVFVRRKPSRQVLDDSLEVLLASFPLPGAGGEP